MRFIFLLALLGATAVTHAAWKESAYAVDSRPGVKQAFVLALPEGATPVRNVVIMIPGGAGAVQPVREGILTEDSAGFSLRGFLAERIGPVAVFAPTTPEGITLEMRETPEHVRDIGAVVETLKRIWPDAHVFVAGLSDGARSASHAGAMLGDKFAGVILLSASPEAFERIGLVKVPVLVVHHRRDSCLYYRDIAEKAKWHTFVTVDDPAKPRPGGARDCGADSAHVFAGKFAQVYQAVADWINTGKSVSDIR